MTIILYYNNFLALGTRLIFQLGRSGLLCRLCKAVFQMLVFIYCSFKPVIVMLITLHSQKLFDGLTDR
jgi:hypothetical protein